LVVAAAFADRSGSATFAFYALLALVVVAAVTALSSYGDLLEAQDRLTRSEPLSPDELAWPKLQALLWAVLLGLAVLGASARAPALGQGVVPGVAETALIASLLLLCVEGGVELYAQSRHVPVVRRVVAPPVERQRRREAA